MYETMNYCYEIYNIFYVLKSSLKSCITNYEVKSIGYKWIYKKKRGVDNEVQNFKARLLEKGLNKKIGMD